MRIKEKPANLCSPENGCENNVFVCHFIGTHFRLDSYRAGDCVCWLSTNILFIPGSDVTRFPQVHKKIQGHFQDFRAFFSGVFIDVFALSKNF